jgi:hypothetical protein
LWAGKSFNVKLGSISVSIKVKGERYVELELEKAIQLRKNGNLKKSNEILMNLTIS